MNVDLGRVVHAAPGVHGLDAREAVTKHGQANWGDASPNEKFMNDQNSWRRRDSVTSRHTDRNGTRFVIVTDFANRTTTVKLP